MPGMRTSRTASTTSAGKVSATRIRSVASTCAACQNTNLPRWEGSASPYCNSIATRRVSAVASRSERRPPHGTSRRTSATSMPRTSWISGTSWCHPDTCVARGPTGCGVIEVCRSLADTASHSSRPDRDCAPEAGGFSLADAAGTSTSLGYRSPQASGCVAQSGDVLRRRRDAERGWRGCAQPGNAQDAAIRDPRCGRQARRVECASLRVGGPWRGRSRQ
jgi:hypothetical protein